jgi:putative membrane protein
MRPLLVPAAALALLTFCTPGNNERRNGGAGDGGPESGMASGNGAGGMSAQDTMARAGGDTASTGTPNGTAQPMTPNGMLSQLNVANTAEIQLSKKAQATAQSPAVKRVAQRLQTDHAKNSKELQALAKKLNVNIVPAAGGATNPDTATVPADLTNKTGAEFDRAFVDHEVQDHQANIDKIQNQMIPAADNPQLKAFLQKTVTAMQGHLRELQQVQQQLQG